MKNAEKKTSAWPPPSAEVWDKADRTRLARLRREALPRHVAVIMDGNGRWARQHGFAERIRGHEAGIEAVRETTRTCAMLGIDALTLYAFSKENWKRPRHEVMALMRLLRKFAVDERRELMENDIRFLTIGDPHDLEPPVRAEVEETVRLTSRNRGTTLTLALSYGSRDEIARAARRLARDVAEGRIAPEDIDESRVAAALDTAGLPDPDLIVRTSGEMRISNFLLWQAAYAEIHVTPVLWPDFRRSHLLEALIDYQGRERRFGRIDAPEIR